MIKLTSLAWIPGQGVKIDYASIVEILIQQLDGERERSAFVMLACVTHCF